MSERFYEWLAECCKELGWSIEKGALLIEDDSWYWCYDDGMSPKAAVKECFSKMSPEPKRENDAK